MPRKSKKPTRSNDPFYGDIEKRLRYMDPKNLVKDFKSPKERAAIVATLQWLSFNSICAWKLKKPGTYSVHVKNIKNLPDHEAILLYNESFDLREKLFAKELEEKL